MNQIELSSRDISLYDLEYEQIAHLVMTLGEPSYRAEQIWKGLYQHYWNTPAEFTTLPKSFRSKLEQAVLFSKLSAEMNIHSSDRQTEKTLFTLPEKQPIETVLMRYRNRNTICTSTQSGCGMGCTFCATGQMGFRRNLSRGEIIEQVLYYARMLDEKGEKVTNIVFMGMGEPFHNYEESMAAIDRLNDSDGFNLGARRFTISTVGLVPMIRRFTSESRQVNLAVSLHAADDQLRGSMLPINHKYPLDELFQACREYVTHTKRRITFEWALIRDVNDSAEQANLLASRIGDMTAHVNVIPLNPTEGYAGEPSTRERAAEFKSVLESHSIPCTIRLRRGIDIQAGCGQLAGDHNSPNFINAS